jgi:hypothetical protein
MSLATSIINLYKKYKKQLCILVLLFFIFNYYYGNTYEGLTQPTCSKYTNCADCVKNYREGDLNIPCLWNNTIKKCNALPGPGYFRTCPASTSESTLETNPESTHICPECKECPKLTLLNTPTFITQQ